MKVNSFLLFLNQKNPQSSYSNYFSSKWTSELPWVRCKCLLLNLLPHQLKEAWLEVCWHHSTLLNRCFTILVPWACQWSTQETYTLLLTLRWPSKTGYPSISTVCLTVGFEAQIFFSLLVARHKGLWCQVGMSSIIISQSWTLNAADHILRHECYDTPCDTPDCYVGTETSTLACSIPCIHDCVCVCECVCDT